MRRARFAGRRSILRLRSCRFLGLAHYPAVQPSVCPSPRPRQPYLLFPARGWRPSALGHFVPRSEAGLWTISSPGPLPHPRIALLAGSRSRQGCGLVVSRYIGLRDAHRTPPLLFAQHQPHVREDSQGGGPVSPSATCAAPSRLPPLATLQQRCGAPCTQAYMFNEVSFQTVAPL